MLANPGDDVAVNQEQGQGSTGEASRQQSLGSGASPSCPGKSEGERKRALAVPVPAGYLCTR